MNRAIPPMITALLTAALILTSLTLVNAVQQAVYLPTKPEDAAEERGVQQNQGYCNYNQFRLL